MENKKIVRRYFGLGLIIAALLFIPLIGWVALMPISVSQKAIVAGILVIGGQIITWIGALLLGRELFLQYRQYLNPLKWFHKK